MNFLENLGPSEIAAWWGAIIATFVLVWNVIKWIKMNKPKIKISVSANNRFINNPLRSEKELWITVRVNNRGDKETTLTNITMIYYRNILTRLLRHAKDQFVVVDPGVNSPIPHVLKPGYFWDGVAKQTNEIEKMGKEGHLIIVIYYVDRNRPVKKRVKFDR